MVAPVDACLSRLTSQMVAAGPRYGARDPPICAGRDVPMIGQAMRSDLGDLHRTGMVHHRDGGMAEEPSSTLAPITTVRGVPNR